MVSLSSVTSRLVLTTSTTGDSPVTVTVSATPPTRSSASIVVTADPLRITPSRLRVMNPASVNVTVYVPGGSLATMWTAYYTGERSGTTTNAPIQIVELAEVA